MLGSTQSECLFSGVFSPKSVNDRKWGGAGKVWVTSRSPSELEAIHSLASLQAMDHMLLGFFWQINVSRNPQTPELPATRLLGSLSLQPRSVGGGRTLRRELTFMIPFQLSPVETRKRVRKAMPKLLKVACLLRPSQGLSSLQSVRETPTPVTRAPPGTCQVQNVQERLSAHEVESTVRTLWPAQEPP